MLVERMTKSKVGEGGGQVVHTLREECTKSKVGNGREKQVVNCMVKIGAKSYVGNVERKSFGCVSMF